ncbi:putative Ig domain-containing protein [Lysobacter enzymogenes]|uniref:putative Ig domain-containing protein n=1 Tax=Lysobacter enzymogenes TaxID=69 RepID=UPI001A95E096|nr:putative Ig domain-containing protein [Lysobacter enzymogenes]QQP98177.1 putative Ig domain-containing protein [Lysobacter enzymogenes]
MSAIVSGIGLGLYNGSAGQIGKGLGGSARLGQGKDEQYVNIATGNLVLRSQDEFLTVRGLGLAAVRTYNSRGQLSDSGADAWITGFERRVELLSGALDAAGSVMRRYTGDGSYQDFVYVSAGLYRSSTGDGAHDTLSRDAASKRWTWVEGSSRREEQYADHADAALKGRLTRIRDLKSDGTAPATWNVLYDAAGRVSEVAAAESGTADALLYTYDGNGRLIALSTRTDGVVREQVTYAYDSAGRLSSVLVDLTPDDPAGDRDSWDAANAANNDGYLLRTVYTYADATSLKLAQVSQSDGTVVSYTYDAQGRVRTLTRGDSNANDADGIGQTLTFTYDDANRSTEVADSTGRSWGYVYDAAGQLTEVRAPAVGGLRDVVQYSYDAAGNLTRIKTLRGSATLSETVYQYDANGNALWQWDTVDPVTGTAATAVQRTWTANNQLASETVYTGLDADRELGAQAPGGGLTTTYVYDAQDRLRFAVGADGAVQEFEYHSTGAGAGQVAKARRYLGAAYTGATTLSALSAWATAAQRAQSTLAESSYDLKGRLAGTTAYARVDGSGNGVVDDAAEIVQYRYDARGLLIQRQTLRSSTVLADDARDVVQTTSYVYDGMDRLLSEIVTEKTGTGAEQVKRNVSQWVYQSSANTVRIVVEGGSVGDGATGNDRVRLEVRDASGQLIRVTESAVGGGDARTLARHYYDSAGRLRASEDAGGARRYFFYDEQGRLAGDVDATGAVVEYLRDDLGRIRQTLSYANRVDTSAWLVAGAVAPAALSAIRPSASADDRSATRGYDALGRLLTERSGDGAIATYSYDGAGRLLQVEHKDGAGNRRVSRSFYDAAGRLSGELDAEGYLVEYSYDLGGRRIGSKAYANVTDGAQRAAGPLAQLRPAADADNDQSTRWFFDGRGNLVGRLDAEGYLTETVFDEARNERASKAYALRLTGLTGNETLSALRSAAASGEIRETRRSFDALGRLSAERNAEGTLTRYSYDVQGNLVRVERAADTSEVRESRLRYNVFGELIGELGGEGSARALPGMSEAQLDALFAQYGVRHSYDSLGRRIESIDAAGHKTWSFYDAAGRETYTVRGVADANGVANALGEVSETRYTAFGEVRDRTAYSGRIVLATAGSRDSAAAAIATLAYVAASDSRRSFGYDARGLLATATDAEGQLRQYTYNAFGERIREAVLNAGATSTMETDYDRRGLAIAGRDGVGTALARSTSLAYDAFGRVIRATDARGVPTTYRYDRLGRQLSSRITVLNREQVVATAYDAFGRTIGVTDALGRTTTSVYDTANRSTTVTTPEGVAVKTFFDRHGQQVKVTSPLPGGAVAESTYAYDRDGHLVSSTDPVGRTATSEYDARGLLAATVDGSGRRIELRYDAVGRLLRRIEDPAGLALTTSYRYDGQGRKVETTDASGRVTAYAYDREGRLTQVALDPAGLNLRTTYSYDAQGRQVRVTEGAGTAAARTVQYDYDALGRRVAERIDPDGLNLLTAYAYDAEDNLIRRTDANGNVTRFYYDQAGQLIYTIDPLGVMTRNWFDPASRVVANRTLILPIDASTLSDGTTIAELDARIPWHQFDPHTFTVYDRDGRPRLIISGSTRMQELIYDAAGRVVATRRYAALWPDFSNARLDKLYRGDMLADESELALLRNDALDQITYNVYTAAGELRTTVDNSGTVVSYVYDRAGRMVVHKRYAHAAQFNPTLRAKLTAGTASPQDVIDVTAVDNAADRVAYTSYDGAGRARYSIDANGGVVETLYDAAGRVAGSRAYANAVALDAVLKPQLVAGDSAAFAALRDRLAASADNARDSREYRIYDGAGRIAAAVDAAGYVAARDYDAAGNLIQERRQARAAALSTALWSKLAAGTASLGELAAVAPRDDSADSATRRVYDAAGRERYALTQTAAGLYTVEERRYDGAGRLIAALRYDSAIALGSEATVATVEAALNLSGSRADGRYRQTRYVYDADGRMRFTIDHLGAVAEQRYDGAGRAVESRKYGGYIPAGTAMTEAAVAAAVAAIADVRKTVTAYDADGNTLSVTDALNQTRRYAYDALSQLRGYTNANGHTWNYDYDLAGRRVAEFSPEVAIGSADTAGVQSVRNGRIVTRTAYDALGNVLSRIENADTAQSRTTRYVYDNRGQQIRTIFPDAGRIDQSTGQLLATGVQPTLEVGYDALGRAVVQKDTRGYYSYKVYDGLGQLAYEVDQEGYVTGYAYDGFGQQTQLRRYAQRINAAALTGWSEGQPISLAQAQGAVAASASDRTLTTRYDQRGLAVQVEQSQVSYYTSSGAAAAGTPTVRTTYDAYGQKVKESTLLEGNAGGADARWADAWLYYDAVGRKTVSVDAEGYVTRVSYNANGEAVESVEYAKAVYTGGLSTAAPPAQPPAGDAVSGYDRVTRWGYDALGRKTSEAAVRHFQGVDGSDGVRDVFRQFRYDGEDRVTQIIDDTGILATTYDALGRAISVTEPVRRVITDNSIQPLLDDATRDLNLSWLYEYSSPYTEMRYDAFGNVLLTRKYATGKRSDGSVTGHAKDQLEYIRYDWQGRAVAVGAANGDTRYSEYDAADHVVRQWYALWGTQAALNATVNIDYVYDKAGRQTQLHQFRILPNWNADDSKQSVEYNAFGEIVRKTHGALQGALNYVYDAAGRLTSSNENYGIRNFGYNLAGHQVREQHVVATSEGQRVDAVTTTVVDRLGRTVLVRQPSHTADPNLSSTLQQVRDRWGNVLEAVDARGYRTNYRYNELNQTTRDERPLVVAVGENGAGAWTRPVNQWFYDALGRLIGTRDANGNLRIQELDAAGQLVRSIDGLGSATLYAYDALGQQRIVQNAAGYLTYSEYDQLGRLVETGDFLPNGVGNRTRNRLQSYVLNQNGDRTKVTDALGNATLYDYSSTHQVARVQTAGGSLTHYGYDVMGRKTAENYGVLGAAIQDRDGETVYLDQLTWDYDVYGRLIDHNNLGGRDFDYHYDAVTGQITAETQSGGGAADFVRYTTYYANGRIKALHENGSAPTYRYEYDAAGNRTLEEVNTTDGAGQPVRTVTRTWYDSNNRIARVIQDDLVVNKRIFDLSYAYDAAGNRRSVSATSSYGPDAPGIPVSNSVPQTLQTPADRAIRRSLSSQFSLLFSDLFRDAEQDPLTLQISLENGQPLPSWLSVQRDPSTGWITFTANPPANAADQDLRIKLAAYETNAPSQSAFTVFNLYLRENVAPRRYNDSVETLKVKTGDSWNKDLLATDFFYDLDVGDRLRLSLDNPAQLPSWLSWDQSAQAVVRLRGTAPTGTYTLQVRATDDKGQSEVKTIQIVVAPNNAPTGPGSLPAAYVVTDRDVTWQVPLSQAFVDADGDRLTLSASGLPAWMSFQRTTVQGQTYLSLSGRPPVGTPSGQVYNIVFTATDTSGASRTTTLTMTTRQANSRPQPPSTIPSPPTAVIGVSGGYWYQLPAFTDADGDALSYRLSEIPPGLNFNPATRVLSGNPTTPGVYNLVVYADDGFGGVGQANIQIWVRNNRTPDPTVIPNQNAMVSVGWYYQLPERYDADYDEVRYSFSGLPAGMGYDASTRTVGGVPTTAGTYTVTVYSSDPYGAASSSQFVITVAPRPPQNLAPYVNRQSPTVYWNVGTSNPNLMQYAFLPADTFGDPDGDAMSYQLLSPSGWTYYINGYGQHVIQHVPPARTQGWIDVFPVVIRATDSKGAYVDMAFDIQVTTVWDGGSPGGPIDPLSLPGGSVLSFEMGAPQSLAAPAQTAALPTPPGPTQSKTYWYTYDAENRIKINNGALTADGIALAGGGYQNTYDAAGNVVARVSILPDQTAPSSGLMETRIDRSDCDLRGNRTVEYHTQVIRGGQMASNGGVFKRMTYDANNRLTGSLSYYGIGAEYQERLPDGEVRFYEYGGWLHAAEHYEYDVDGRLKLQHAWERVTGDGSWVVAASNDNVNNRQSTDIGVLGWRGSTHYVVTLGDAKATGYDALGRLTTYMVYGMAPDNRQYIHTYTNTYQGWESYQLVSTTGTSNHNSFKPTTNTLSYDALGRLMSQREHTTLRNGSIDDRMRYYAYNGDGAVMQRREGRINDSGQFVQDGPMGADNFRLIHAGGVQQAELRQTSYNRTTGNQYAYSNQFVSLNGLGGYEAGDAASKVMPLAGETLRGLAQRVYGSELMWYLIAEANGLSDPAKELVPGLGLVVPKAVVSRNDSSTFKPYNPGEAIGSTSPELPYIAPPPKDGCGGFGIIMMAIVVVAVSFATWGTMTAPTASAMGAAASATAVSVSTLGAVGSGAALTATAALAPSLGTAVLAGATAGVAGSIAGQAVGSMMGVTSFSLRNALSAGVTGGLTAGLGNLMGVSGVQSALAQSPVKAAGMALGGAAASYIGQKIAGIDQGFSWRAIAANAASQYISAGISAAIGQPAPQLFGGTGSMLGDFSDSMIGGVVSLHTRRAFGFNDDIDYKRIAQDAFGNALGNAIGRGYFAQSSKSGQSRRSMGGVEDSGEIQTASGRIAPSVVLDDSTTREGRAAKIDNGWDVGPLNINNNVVDREYRPVLVTAVRVDDLQIDSADLREMLERDVSAMYNAGPESIEFRPSPWVEQYSESLRSHPSPVASAIDQIRQGFLRPYRPGDLIKTPEHVNARLAAARYASERAGYLGHLQGNTESIDSERWSAEQQKRRYDLAAPYLPAEIHRDYAQRLYSLEQKDDKAPNDFREMQRLRGELDDIASFYIRGSSTGSSVTPEEVVFQAEENAREANNMMAGQVFAGSAIGLSRVAGLNERQSGEMASLVTENVMSFAPASANRRRLASPSRRSQLTGSNQVQEEAAALARIKDANANQSAKALDSRINSRAFPEFDNPTKLTEHFEKHGARLGATSEAEYLEMGLYAIRSGHKIRYKYPPSGNAAEKRTGYIAFLRNSNGKNNTIAKMANDPHGGSPSGQAYFVFVGTNNYGKITTIHIKNRTEVFRMIGDTSQSHFNKSNTKLQSNSDYTGYPSR